MPGILTTQVTFLNLGFALEASGGKVCPVLLLVKILFLSHEVLFIVLFFREIFVKKFVKTPLLRKRNP